MNTNNTSNFPHSSAPGIRKASDELANAAGSALDSTRDQANEVLERAENKVRELRGQVDPMVDMLTAKAQKLARQSLEIAAEAKERAEKSLKTAADATTRYVAEQPMRSVLMAAAVGAAVALLVAASRSRNRNRY